MRPVSNRGIYLLLGFCFLFLLAVIVLIVFINRPISENPSTVPSPTPIPGDSSDTPGSRNPSIPHVVGESSFTEEETRRYLESRRQAEQAYKERLRRMPFITKLPYTTTHFKIEITAVSDTIYITTYGPPNFQARYREEALAWLRQNGGNPDTLAIQYKN